MVQQQKHKTKPKVAPAVLRAKAPVPVGGIRAQVRSIPKAPVSRGLRFKNPKMKGPDQIQNRLKKKSPWFTSINDPLHGADCKIPDETGVETGTLQLVQRHTTKANSNGLCGVRIYSPYVNSAPLNTTGSATGLNYQLLNSTSDFNNIEWNDGSASVAPAGNFGFSFDGYTDIQAITNSHRVVSCAIIIQPETSLSENKGELTLFSSAFKDFSNDEYVDYGNHFKSAIMPINCNKAAQVTWYPVAKEDISFKSFMATVGTEFDEAIESPNSVPIYQLGFIAWAEPDSIFRVTMVVNYEFIPTWNTLNVLDVKPSPNDSQEVDLVENWVQDMEVAKPVSQTRVSSSPSSVSPSHEDDETGFGMFFHVISELAPLALALL